MIKYGYLGTDGQGRKLCEGKTTKGKKKVVAQLPNGRWITVHKL